jgi:hypothetical protein
VAAIGAEQDARELDAELVGELSPFAEQLEGNGVDRLPLVFDEDPYVPVCLQMLRELLLLGGTLSGRRLGGLCHGRAKEQRSFHAPRACSAAQLREFGPALCDEGAMKVRFATTLSSRRRRSPLDRHGTTVARS